MSTDLKAVVKVGEFSRGGQSRVLVKAQDHDFQPDATLTPAGILLPAHGELFISMVESKATSDCIVDELQHVWTLVKPHYPLVRTILLDQDNGPENHSRRTQFIKRIIEFADSNQINVRLAYYPPYHSKYNPIERCWGALENYWRGSLLDSVHCVLEMAGAMRWQGKHPVVRLVSKVYETGVRLTKDAMKELELRLKRLPGLEKWFVDIPFLPAST
jgi:hypothetical protein